MPSKALWHAELALLPSGVVPRVLIEVEGERISALTPDTDPPPSASRLPGFTLPGLANAHSHAFHRALRGRTQRERGDFWSWRRRMYELAGRLDPESYLALATAVYAEMTLAGVTAVGEFHYIHHDQEGRRYADPNEMGLALAAAASKAGIRLTLIDTCYLRGDLKGRPLEGPQLRFGDGDASTWAERVGKLQAGPTLRIAAGIHSVRALHPGAMRQVASWAAERSAPLHLHLSEQRAENDECLAVTGLTPAALADRCGVGHRRQPVVRRQRQPRRHRPVRGVPRLGVGRAPGLGPPRPPPPGRAARRRLDWRHGGDRLARRRPPPDRRPGRLRHPRPGLAAAGGRPPRRPHRPRGVRRHRRRRHPRRDRRSSRGRATLPRRVGGCRPSARQGHQSARRASAGGAGLASDSATASNVSQIRWPSYDPLLPKRIHLARTG